MIGFYMPEFKLIIPEIIIVLSAFFVLLEGVLRQKEGFYLPRHSGLVTLLSLVIALGVLIFQYKPGEKWVTFEGQIRQDDFIYFAKLLVLVGSAAVLAISLPSMIKEHIFSFEYSALILLATIGMLLMVEANDFISLFVGLELQGMSLYVLAALDRDRFTSSEAALKYFILGALSTCLYLYGTSLIYGFSGSTNFDVLGPVLRIESQEGLPLGLLIGLVFIMAAFSFKISAVPFHMWTPDVYEGCPTAITAFIAAGPKIAAMLIFLRLMLTSFMVLYEEWQSLIVFLSFASMVLGAFAALRQTSLKRLLAYGTIGHMGYVLMGFAAGNNEGIQAVFVYLTLYLIMIVGTFGCLLCLRGKGSMWVKNVGDLAGISTLHPKIAFILALLMFSLAGIPPLAGFFAKLYVFKAALSAGLFTLAIVGVLSSVVASYYYLKIVKVMYFDAIPETLSLSFGQVRALSLEMRIVLDLSAAIILFFFMYPSPVLEMAQRAALSLLH